MRVLILGIDGYIGWALALHLLKKGHEIRGLDDGSRRMLVQSVGSDSLIPIGDWPDRVGVLKNHKNFGGCYSTSLGEESTYGLWRLFESFEPEVIFHLAELPSAPYSMRDLASASTTQRKNVIGTLQVLWTMHQFKSKAHLIKIGTMGEYGTPDCDIPEGRIGKHDCFWIKRVDQELSTTPPSCPLEGLLFPRTPGSFYHASKVMDTINIEFACRNWGLTSTDIMQGVVFGLNECEHYDELTRFDYDECFGTVINRFCVQALICMAPMIYGKGEQTRGFLPLKDSLQCLTLAMENPPKQSEYRTLNQFGVVCNILDLAHMVESMSRELGLECHAPTHVPNPRKEAESHYYNPTNKGLIRLGYRPTVGIDMEIIKLIQQLRPYRDRIKKEVIIPKIHWQ